MSLNWTHHHLLNKLIDFFEQMDREQPDKSWLCKAYSLELIDKEIEYRMPKEQVVKSGVVCCGTCGHRIKDGYTYCNHCGQKQISIYEKGGGANDSTDK